jgi:hypothetical protein
MSERNDKIKRLQACRAGCIHKKSPIAKSDISVVIKFYSCTVYMNQNMCGHYSVLPKVQLKTLKTIIVDVFSPCKWFAKLIKELKFWYIRIIYRLMLSTFFATMLVQWTIRTDITISNGHFQNVSIFSWKSFNYPLASWSNWNNIHLPFKWKHNILWIAGFLKINYNRNSWFANQPMAPSSVLFWVSRVV